MSQPPPPPSAIGLTLRQRRKALGWGLEEVAARIHIKAQYLRALEEERWEDLPSPAHAKGFLRLYASVLGLDPEPLLQMLTGGPETPPPITSTSTPTALRTAWRPQRVELLQTLGQRLRERREQLGYSLEQVVQHTHIAEPYLQALEKGDLSPFAAIIQARGMLTLYAQFLHLDVQHLLELFDQAVTSDARSFSSGSEFAWQRWIRGMSWLLYIGLIGGVGLLLVWGGSLVWQTWQASVQPTPTLPPINTRAPAAAAAQTAQAVATQLAGPGMPAFNPTTPVPEQAASPPEDNLLPPEEQAPIFLVVVARYRVWLRVLTDGQPAFQGRLRPGEQRTFRAQERVELLVANAGALRVVFNQQDLGVLGDWGQVNLFVFTPQEILTPTPTPTPTPTITPTPTTSPTPTTTTTPTPTVLLPGTEPAP